MKPGGETESTRVVYFRATSRCNEPLSRVVRSKPPPMWSWVSLALSVAERGHKLSLWVSELLGRQALRVNLTPQQEHRGLRA